MKTQNGKIGWRFKKLKNLPIQIIDGDRSSRYPKRDEFQTEGILFLNTTNINQNRFDLIGANFVTSEKFAQIKKGRLQPLDIVMTTRGSVGKVALFNTPQYSTGLINAQMLILRADGNEIDHKFLFYLLCSDVIQGEIRNFASGAAQPQIPIQDLREIEISYPPLPTQRKIAAILSAYDDLIENNTRRIAILEEMAQLIYREWFVHYRFPGHEGVRLVESELGPLPEGWQIVSLGDVLKLIHGYAFKSEQFRNEKTTVIAVRMGNFKEVGGLQFEDNTKYLSEGDYKDKYLLNLLHSKKGEAKEN
jgi:type I restriction enzyme S subunit